MGLKEEMTADVDTHVAAKMESRKTLTKRPDTNVHQHGDGKCEELWTDDEGKRRTRVVQGRVPKYRFNCKVCKTEDAKRMSEPSALTEEDLDHTVFLIPERAYDQRVARAYLTKRYPNAEILAMADIRPARLAMHQGSKIVVVVRRALPGNAAVGPEVVQTEDRHGSTITSAVPPEKYIDEIVESAPVNVSDHVTASPTTMFADADVDLTELRLHLCDLAAPGYFIAQYNRIVGSQEKVFTLRVLTH